MGFLTRCKRPFLFDFLLHFCNMLFSFFLKTFLILFEKQHRPVFWQVKQKAQRILCVFTSIFVTVAGKSASEATLKASAVNCAVLP